MNGCIRTTLGTIRQLSTGPGISHGNCDKWSPLPRVISPIRNRSDSRVPCVPSTFMVTNNMRPPQHPFGRTQPCVPSPHHSMHLHRRLVPSLAHTSSSSAFDTHRSRDAANVPLFFTTTTSITTLPLSPIPPATVPKNEECARRSEEVRWGRWNELIPLEIGIGRWNEWRMIIGDMPRVTTGERERRYDGYDGRMNDPRDVEKEITNAPVDDIRGDETLRCINRAPAARMPRKANKGCRPRCNVMRRVRKRFKTGR